ncbi:MAG: prenyltransferase/squalene oxidase repeat-containing protein [Victivallaceae bacterium]
MNNSQKILLHNALALGSAALKEQRQPDGLWRGCLSSSAVSTAVAAFALETAALNKNSYALDEQYLVDTAVKWLAEHQNRDGGWGDTPQSPSNLSATLLARSTLLCRKENHEASEALQNSAAWLTRNIDGCSPAAIRNGILEFYGKDLTFSVPILTMCALSGQLDEKTSAWRSIPQLPFELAALPQRFFNLLNLPVVSYAIPALIAAGLARFRNAGKSFSPLSFVRRMAVPLVLRKLSKLQPENGGFLEAAPLTGFVTMCLASAGLANSPVVNKGLQFLTANIREDSSWPIDTDLSIWLTTLAVKALDIPGEMTSGERAELAALIKRHQSTRVNRFTLARPGGWAWTDHPGGVPDADDTAGALAALAILQPDNCDSQVIAGIEWLLRIQNRDGGIPTFCRGWGLLPFDKSCPDISAHALKAFLRWRDKVDPAIRKRIDSAMTKIIAYLAKEQRQFGSWRPLWFGDQQNPRQYNPVYGTAMVLKALKEDPASPPEMITAAVKFLVGAQNADGGWGGAAGLPSNVECTGVAVDAISGFPAAAEQAFSGAVYIAEKITSAVNSMPEPTAVGLYFASLWYDEQLYPLLFGLPALRAVVPLIK